MSGRILLRSPQHAIKRRGSTPKSLKRSYTLIFLRCAWVLATFYGEFLIFVLDVAKCQWPAVLDAFDHHLLIITDPQLPDHRSYASRNWLLRSLTNAVIENYARKAYSIVRLEHRPRSVVFLGDLLDSGVYAKDRLEHAHYASKFKRTFPTQGLQTIYIPGNHDLGLHLPAEEAVHAREQFKDEFGPLNAVIHVANHSLVYVNSMGLLEDNARQEATRFSQDSQSLDSTWSFVHELANINDPLPAILFLHIPLYRPEGTQCGPLREHKRPIFQGAGANYQNLLDEASSRKLLEYTQPIAIYSGDDHDFCQVKHRIVSPASWTSEVTEITIKAFSMVMNVKRPGYQLVSLNNPASTRSPTLTTHASASCLLPDQIGVYTRLYFPLLLFTTLVIFFPRAYRYLQNAPKRTASPSNLKRSHNKTYSKGYNHARALSKQSLYSDSDPSSEDNEFGYSDSTPNVGYSYHTDEEGLPTPVLAASYLDRKRQSDRVRRVSRVWMWDGRRKEDDDRTTGMGSRLLRPISGCARSIFHKFWVPWLGYWIAKSGISPILSHTTRDLVKVLWPALSLAVAVWLWFIA